MQRLKSIYTKEVKVLLLKQFQYNNIHNIPKLEKIVINRGFDETCQNTKILEVLNLPRDHPIKLILLHLMKIKSHKKGTINLLYPDHIKMKDYKKYN